jgi:hypothetical protein
MGSLIIKVGLPLWCNIDGSQTYLTVYHRNKHLDPMTTHRLDADSTCQLARTRLFDSSSSPERRSWRDCRHHLAHQQSYTSMVLSTIVPRRPLQVISPNGCASPCPWRRHARHLLPVAPLIDSRSPRGASTGRLHGANAASPIGFLYKHECIARKRAPEGLHTKAPKRTDKGD